MWLLLIFALLSCQLLNVITGIEEESCSQQQVNLSFVNVVFQSIWCAIYLVK